MSAALYDAIIIGAGPAGASAALFLHRRGLNVALLDQAKFPRDKVCGEFISPAADAILEDLGVLADLEKLNPTRLKGVAVSAYEKNQIFIDYPDHPQTGSVMTSLSIPRVALDNLLAEKVRASGIKFLENHRVQKFLFDGDRIVGVKGLGGKKSPFENFEYKARAVIDAGGRNGISLRQLNLKIQNGRGKKIALAAHWEGIRRPMDYCHMHISRPGYTGMSRVDGNRANVVLVVDGDLVKGRNTREFYLDAVLKNSLRREALDGATLAEDPRAIESLAFAAKPVPCDGLVMVGDVMGFLDPFTGEGIYLALRSAQLASGVIAEALQGEGAFNLVHNREYERQRENEFRDKFALSKALQFLIYKPALCNWVVGVLAKNPDMAQRLVGVIGDYVPARDVTSANFLLEFLWKAIFPRTRAPLAEGMNQAKMENKKPVG